MGIKLGYFHILCVLFLGSYFTGVDARCTKPPNQETITEVDPPDTLIFTHNIIGNASWTFEFKEPATVADELKGYFRLQLNDSTFELRVNKTVDLEELFPKVGVITSVNFKFHCFDDGANQVEYESIVVVSAVNEFAPEFANDTFYRTVSEDESIGKTVITLRGFADDKDVSSQQDEIHAFYVHPYSLQPQLDGSRWFNMTQNQRGEIQMTVQLDYEMMDPKYVLLNVSVEDIHRSSSFATVHINVEDANDQPPEFFDGKCKVGNCFFTYRATVNQKRVGVIQGISPSKIQARDRDLGINSTLKYSIQNVEPNELLPYFQQNLDTGEVSVTQPLANTPENISMVTIYLQATEVSLRQRRGKANLQIRVFRPTTIIVTSSKTTTAVTSTSTKGENSTQLPTTHAPESSNQTLVIVLIVLGVFLFLVLLIFVIVVLILRKKMVKRISPEASATTSENPTDVEDLSEDSREQWPQSQADVNSQGLANQMLVDNGQVLPPLKGGRLPPLKDTGTGTDGQMPKRSRRRKKKQKEDNEEFDGTKEYEGQIEVDFFGQRKARVKQSSRSKEKLDPKYWITVDNDY